MPAKHLGEMSRVDANRRRLHLGRGVIPDIPAKLSRAALLAGRDPVLERAIQFIQTSK
jgi:hypothetical protein